MSSEGVPHSSNASEDTPFTRPRREKSCFKHIRFAKKGSHDEDLRNKRESLMDSLSLKEILPTPIISNRP